MNYVNPQGRKVAKLQNLFLAAMLIAASFLSACASDKGKISKSEAAAVQAAKASADADANKLLLREGDTVRISFPGAPNLNTAQTIRRDGKLALALVGEVQAAGLAPTELEKKLLELYGPQLQTKEVTV